MNEGDGDGPTCITRACRPIDLHIQLGPTLPPGGLSAHRFIYSSLVLTSSASSASNIHGNKTFWQTRPKEPNQ